MALGRPAPMGMQEARNRTSRTALCFCATWGPRSLFQALRLVPFHSRRSRQRSGGLTSTTSFVLCPNLSSTGGGFLDPQHSISRLTSPPDRIEAWVGFSTFFFFNDSEFHLLSFQWTNALSQLLVSNGQLRDVG